jgi:hypothetical protein
MRIGKVTSYKLKLTVTITSKYYLFLPFRIPAPTKRGVTPTRFLQSELTEISSFARYYW